MFRLKATLDGTTRLRPWRTGWSVDRGVDFSLAAAARPATAPTVACAVRSAAEPVSFIDEDWALPPQTTVVRRFESLGTTGAAIEAPAEDALDTAGLRVWWSLSGKP